MTETVTSTCYLVVEGTRNAWSNRIANEGRVVAVRAKKPASLVGDQVAVKLTVAVPKAAFEPLSTDLVLTVPEDMVLRPTTEIADVHAE